MGAVTHSAHMWWCVCVLQALTEFFGSLSADWALECLKELLLTNMQVRLDAVWHGRSVLSVQCSTPDC